MTREEANQMLEEAFAADFELENEVVESAIKSYNRLKITEYRTQGKTSGNLRTVAVERLHALPVMNVKQEGKQEGEQIVLMVGSGFKDRNPTVLEVVIHGADVTVTGWAKEGLIPQRSAKKAVKAAVAALKLDSDR